MGSSASEVPHQSRAYARVRTRRMGFVPFGSAPFHGRLDLHGRCGGRWITRDAHRFRKGDSCHRWNIEVGFCDPGPVRLPNEGLPIFCPATCSTVKI